MTAGFRADVWVKQSPSPASPFNRTFPASAAAVLEPLIVGEPRVLDVPEGASLAEFVAYAVEQGAISERVAVLPQLRLIIGNDDIPRALWRVVRPKAGVTVRIVVRASGGKNLLRTILTLAVTALAFWAAPFVAGAIGLAGTFGTSLVTGVLSLAGNALINIIAPIPQPNAVERSQTYAISGTSNQAKPWQACSFVAGWHRVTPPYAARSFTRIYAPGSDDKVVLYGLVQWHVGKCEVSDIKIGETPIEEFNDVVTQHRLLGEPYADEIDLIPTCVYQVPEQLEIKQANGWQNRAFPRGADRLWFDLARPDGMFKVQEDGDYVDREVDLDIQYREVGSSTWIDWPSTGNPDKMDEDGVIHFDANIRSAQYDAFFVDVTRGNYEMQIRRVTADTSSSRIADRVVLTALAIDRVGAPVLDDDLCLTAFRVVATDQLNGAIDALNGIVKPIIPIWNGVNWDDEGTSRNPAAWLRWLHTGPVIEGRERLTAADFDETLEDFYEYCDEMGLTVDHVFDYGPSVEDAAQLIASCGNAHIGWKNGKRSIVIDQAKTMTQAFTSSTIANLEGRLLYPKPVHALRASYADADDGYLIRECIAYADGYDASTALYYETVEVPGKTAYSDVWRSLRRMLKRLVIRREEINFLVDFRFLETEFGARAGVEHFALMGRTTSGWIKQVSLNESDAALGVELDEVTTYEAGASYALRWTRVADGTVVTAALVNPATTVDVKRRYAEFLGPVSAATAPSADDEYAWGELGRVGLDVSIIDINPQEGDRAMISCVPYSDTLFADDIDESPFTRMTTAGAIRFTTNGIPRVTA